ncbi:hypothetical protein NJ7G_0200 [Natrinema sp. J7-2]|nr:hypothetical protein NJ7G_0200 [Natrinema sp. J7-2]
MKSLSSNRFRARSSRSSLGRSLTAREWVARGNPSLGSVEHTCRSRPLSIGV